MRPLEIVTIILIIGLITSLFTHKKRDVFLYLLFASILSTLSQHFIEGNRWQFAPAIYLLPACYVFHRFQKNSINKITKIFLIIWLGLAIILPWAIPVFKLPSHGGDYDVGTNTFHWVDSSRMEWFTKEDSLDVREIMVQAWYPGNLNNEKEPEPYLDYIDLRAATIASAGNIPKFFPSHLTHIITNSYNEIPFNSNDSFSPLSIKVFFFSSVRACDVVFPSRMCKILRLALS